MTLSLIRPLHYIPPFELQCSIDSECEWIRPLTRAQTTYYKKAPPPRTAHLALLAGALFLILHSPPILAMIKSSIAIATLFAVTVIEPRCIEVADDYVESSGWEPPRFINWGCPNMTGTDCGEKVPDAIQKSDCPCPDGWLHYEDSCYRLEHDLLNMANAHKSCKECDATLFVPNSQAELNYMNRRMTKGMFHWIGLAKFNEQQQPQWQAVGGMPVTELPWLIKDHAAEPNWNGWSNYGKCGAYYPGVSQNDTKGYNYYYSCDLMFYSVCERNATLNNLMNQNSAVLY